MSMHNPDRLTGYRLLCAWALLIIVPWSLVGALLWLVLK